MPALKAGSEHGAGEAAAVAGTAKEEASHVALTAVGAAGDVASTDSRRWATPWRKALNTRST